MNDSLNDFVIGNRTNGSAIRGEALEPQKNSCWNNFGRNIAVDNSECENQILENTIDDTIRNVVDSAVIVVGNRVHDAILTAMDSVVIPRVYRAVRSVNESSGRGTSSVVRNPDQRDFTGNTENTRLMSVFSRKDLNFDRAGTIKLVILKTSSWANFRHYDINITGERKLITW